MAIAHFNKLTKMWSEIVLLFINFDVLFCDQFQWSVVADLSDLCEIDGSWKRAVICKEWNVPQKIPWLPEPDLMMRGSSWSMLFLLQ